MGQSVASSQGAEGKVSIKLKWREGKKAPCVIHNMYNGEMAAAMDGNFVYVMDWTRIYACNVSTLAWSQFPESSFSGCALAIINKLLTLIGGNKSPHRTNKLLSLTGKGKTAEWTEEFPPMPTSRYGACALCTDQALIVAGGQGEIAFCKVAAVEVLNTATLQWSTADDLPQPTFCGSLLQAGDDHIYMVGAYDKDRRPIKSVSACSLNALLQSCKPQSFGARRAVSPSPSQVWGRVADIPAIDSAYVFLHNHLLAIGGKDSGGKLIAAVRMYSPSTKSWEVISHMTTPRRKCYAAVLPDNQLIVVGGCIDDGYAKTDSVEIATSLFRYNNLYYYKVICFSMHLMIMHDNNDVSGTL